MLPRELLNDWTVSSESGSNAAQTLTKAAPGADRRHWITGYEVTITAAGPTTADCGVELRSAANRKWKSFFGSGAVRGARLFVFFTRPIPLNKNEAANLVVDAAGVASGVTSASLMGYTLDG